MQTRYTLHLGGMSLKSLYYYCIGSFPSFYFFAMYLLETLGSILPSGPLLGDADCVPRTPQHLPLGPGLARVC